MAFLLLTHYTRRNLSNVIYSILFTMFIYTQSIIEMSEGRGRKPKGHSPLKEGQQERQIIQSFAEKLYVNEDNQMKSSTYLFEQDLKKIASQQLEEGQMSQQNQQLKRELEFTKKEMDGLLVKLQGHESRVKKLKRRINELEGRTRELLVREKKLEDRMKDIQFTHMQEIATLKIQLQVQRQELSLSHLTHKNKIEKQIRLFQEKNRQLSHHNLTLDNQIQQLCAKLQTCQHQNQTALVQSFKKIETLQMQLNVVRRKKEAVEVQLKEQKMIEGQIHKNHEIQLETFKMERQRLNKDVSELTKAIKQTVEYYRMLESNKKKAEEQMREKLLSLEERYRSLGERKEKEQKEMQDKYKTLALKKKELQISYKELEEEKKKEQELMENNYRFLQKQKKEILGQKNDLLKSNSQKEKQINQKNKIIKQLAQDKEQMERHISDLQGHLGDLKKVKDVTERGVALIQSTVGLRGQKTLGLKQDYKMRMLMEEIEKEIIRIKYFGDSQILEKLPISKREFLAKEIGQFLKEGSFQSKLIYRFDPLNSTNFHRYFDNKENLLILILLKNGSVLGGFTCFPYSSSHVQRPGKGLLINLNHEMCYKVRENPRLPVTSYDQYFFILGNAEIRIRSQEQRMFSNFGIANSTFDSKGDSRTKFLNVKDLSDNELDFQTYEFYQLIFKS